MRKSAARTFQMNSTLMINVLVSTLIIVTLFKPEVCCEKQSNVPLRRNVRSSYLQGTNAYKFTSDVDAISKYKQLQNRRINRLAANSTVYKLVRHQLNETVESATTAYATKDLTTLHVPFSYLLNASSSPLIGRRIFDDIYDKQGNNESTRRERFQQIGSWLSDHDSLVGEASTKVEMKASASGAFEERVSHDGPEPPKDHYPNHPPASDDARSDNEEYANDYDEEGGDGPSGTTKTPPCAQHGRYYCSHTEDYPTKVVTEVARYYKWPLEKLFRDLRQQVMPKLANDQFGGLVCDSVTRVVRPGWAKNTNNRWLVVINTEHHQQFVSEVICRHGSGSYCNFIPPCYQATCRQRYNTQKLLVIDPWNPYKGPFLSEFLFPSCCVCFIPDTSDNHYSSASNEVRKKSETSKSEL